MIRQKYPSPHGLRVRDAALVFVGLEQKPDNQDFELELQPAGLCDGSRGRRRQCARACAEQLEVGHVGCVAAYVTAQLGAGSSSESFRGVNPLPQWNLAGSIPSHTQSTTCGTVIVQLGDHLVQQRRRHTRVGEVELGRHARRGRSIDGRRFTCAELRQQKFEIHGRLTAPATAARRRPAPRSRSARSMRRCRRSARRRRRPCPR